MQIPLFLQTGQVIEDPASSRYRDTGIGRIDNLYILKGLAKHYSIKPFQLAVTYNLNDASSLLETSRISGLIIPHGHGDYHTLSNLGLKEPDLDFPVFKGYNFRFNSIEKAFEEWLLNNFQIRKLLSTDK